MYVSINQTDFAYCLVLGLSQQLCAHNLVLHQHDGIQIVTAAARFSAGSAANNMLLRREASYSTASVVLRKRSAARSGGEQHHFALALSNASQLPAFTTPLNVDPAENAGPTLSGMSMTSPVEGLRPLRAARVRGLKLPKPGMVTVLPSATDSMISSRRESTISPMSLREILAESSAAMRFSTSTPLPTVGSFAVAPFLVSAVVAWQRTNMLERLLKRVLRAMPLRANSSAISRGV